MQTSILILITISIMLIIEGMVFALSAKHILKSIKKLNAKTIIKLSLIEIIIGLLILFLVVV